MLAPIAELLEQYNMIVNIRMVPGALDIKLPDQFGETRYYMTIDRQPEKVYRSPEDLLADFATILRKYPRRPNLDDIYKPLADEFPMHPILRMGNEIYLIFGRRDDQSYGAAISMSGRNYKCACFLGDHQHTYTICYREQLMDQIREYASTCM